MEQPKPTEQKEPVQEVKAKPIVEPPKKLDQKPKSMSEKIDAIEESLKKMEGVEANKGKDKSFKLPFKIRGKTKNPQRLLKKNEIQVMILRQGKQIETKMGTIQMGILICGDYYWNAADDITWSWQGKVPTAIVCDWDMQPLTIRRLMDDTETLKTWLHPQTITIRLIEAKQLLEKAKSKMNFGIFIIIGVILIAAYWLFFSGG